jgi:hypothetical protein
MLEDMQSEVCSDTHVFGGYEHIRSVRETKRRVDQAIGLGFATRISPYHPIFLNSQPNQDKMVDATCLNEHFVLRKYEGS